MQIPAALGLLGRELKVDIHWEEHPAEQRLQRLRWLSMEKRWLEGGGRGMTEVYKVMKKVTLTPSHNPLRPHPMQLRGSLFKTNWILMDHS